jgi:hypothetical protein
LIGGSPDPGGPLSGDDEWFDGWFDRAWEWITSAPADPADDSAPAAAGEATGESPSSSILALPSLPSSMFRSSGVVRGPSTRRRDPMAGETLREGAKERSKINALRIECADPLSRVGRDLKWLRRDADVAIDDQDDDPPGGAGDER